jgi:hypothetical protein
MKKETFCACVLMAGGGVERSQFVKVRPMYLYANLKIA